MKLSDFDYTLPKGLIAQEPEEKRDHSRLMVVSKDKSKNKHEKNIIQHKHFYELLDYLNKDDVLVINDTKVMKLKFTGRKTTGGKAEMILGNKVSAKRYEARIKATKTGIGTQFVFGSSLKELKLKELKLKELKCVVVDKVDDKFVVEFGKDYSPEMLAENGEMPLPPYVKDYKGDAERYQTIYAEKNGSVAAPTAGLHFSRELMEEIIKKGVKIAKVCLHVSFGTFIPVKEEDIAKHKMEPEYFIVDEYNAGIINHRKGRLFVVGTTALKTLETSADDNGKVIPAQGWSRRFIYPGYKFKVVPDGFITNLHLPKSTLIMLVSAYFGRENILDAYSVAIKERYRFFSFGDAMLLLQLL